MIGNQAVKSIFGCYRLARDALQTFALVPNRKFNAPCISFFFFFFKLWLRIILIELDHLNISTSLRYAHVAAKLADMKMSHIVHIADVGELERQEQHNMAQRNDALQSLTVKRL